MSRGFDIDSHDTQAKTITYTANRSKVFKAFKAFAQNKLDAFLGKAKFRISEAQVDAIIGLGGSVERTAAQVMSVLIDRVTND